MKMACSPSHVMREGSDLNQQGHGARQEHPSSKPPATFHEVFAPALPDSAAVPMVTTPHAKRTPLAPRPNRARLERKPHGRWRGIWKRRVPAGPRALAG